MSADIALEEVEAMYNVKKFPELDKDAWITENRELVDQQVSKFEGLLDESIKGPLQEVIAEYVYLSSTMLEIEEWKDNFARFLSYTMNVDEGHLRDQDSGRDVHGGRLSLLKELLEWF